MNFNGGLIKGETYTLTTYNNVDDFSNIANVQNGTINTTGSVFIATGEIPNNWSNNSELSSQGDLIVDVLENTLGFDISWVQAPYGYYGYYVAFDSFFGPFYNRFPRSKTDVKVGIKYPYDWFGSFSPIPISSIGGPSEKDEAVSIDMYYDGDLLNNSLYYTPVEIKINKDLDTTPITVYGINVSLFSYGNPSVRIFAGEFITILIPMLMIYMN